MSKMSPIAAFLYARIAEDENALTFDERHWSEVPSSTFSNARLSDELEAKKALVKGLSLVADLAWTGSYAVRDIGRELLERMAFVYEDHPDYRNDWWTTREQA